MYNAPPPGGYGYQPQQQHNPYAAPSPYAQQMDYRHNANFFVPPGSRAGNLPQPWLKTGKLFAGITAITLVLFGIGLVIGGAASRDQQSVLPLFGMLGIFTSYVAFFAYAVLNWIWIYQMWSWLPPEERYSNMWKKYVSPGTAIGFMFIPYFNIYWRFVVYLGIGEILDRMAVRYPSQQPAVKGFAMVPPIVGIVFFPALPIVDYIFAKKAEARAKEMAAMMGQPVG